MPARVSGCRCEPARSASCKTTPKRHRPASVAVPGGLRIASMFDQVVPGRRGRCAMAAVRLAPEDTAVARRSRNSLPSCMQEGGEKAGSSGMYPRHGAAGDARFRFRGNRASVRHSIKSRACLHIPVEGDRTVSHVDLHASRGRGARKLFAMVFGPGNGRVQVVRGMKQAASAVRKTACRSGSEG